MIVCRFAVYCRTTSISPTTNSLTIIDMIEEIAGPELPARIEDATMFVALFRREDSDPEVDHFILKINNSGTEIFQGRVEMDFQGKKRLRNQVVLQGGLIIKEFGILTFQVVYKGKVLKEYIVDVNKDVSEESITPSSRKKISAKKSS